MGKEMAENLRERKSKTMGKEMAEKDHERDEEMLLGEGKWQRK